MFLPAFVLLLTIILNSSLDTFPLAKIKHNWFSISHQLSACFSGVKFHTVAVRKKSTPSVYGTNEAIELIEAKDKKKCFLLCPSPVSVSSFFQDHVAKVIIYLHFVNLIRTLTSANHYRDTVNGNRICSQTAIDLSCKLYILACFCDHDPKSVLTLNLKTVWDTSHMSGLFSSKC